MTRVLYPAPLRDFLMRLALTDLSGHVGAIKYMMNGHETF